MKKTLIISIFIFLFIILIRYFASDTGIFFAYDYLKNKIDINYTSNQVNLNNVNLQNNDYEYSIKNIKGLKYRFNNFLNPLKINKEQLAETDTWIRSNGGNFSNKYSNLDLINLNNIQDLELYFKKNLNSDIIKKKWMNNVETNPIFFEGILFFITPFKEIIALEVESKKILWKFKSLKKINSRGMTLWINKKKKMTLVFLFQLETGCFA